MKDPELEFIEEMGISKDDLENIPDFMVRTFQGEDKVQMVFRSSVEPAKYYGDRTMITISRQDFKEMVYNLTHILAKYYPEEADLKDSLEEAEKNAEK